jgi:subtilisin family serine protease
LEIGGTPEECQTTKGILSIILMGILIASGLGIGGLSFYIPSLERSSSLDEYDMIIISQQSGFGFYDVNIRKPLTGTALVHYQGKNVYESQTPEINVIPNDPLFTDQWALHNTGQTGGTPDADIDAVEAWDIETGNPGIVIAVVDSGIDFNHPDLIDIVWINEDEIADNGIDDDGNGYVDDIYGYDFQNEDNDCLPLDHTGHGTALSGIIAALTNNDVGISGIAWNCKIMPVQVLSDEGSTPPSMVADAIRYAADNGAKVICMALGFMFPSSALENAVNYAYDRGVFLCCAAGNFDNDRKTYPAAYDHVTAVAGTDHNDQRMEGYYECNGIWVNSSYGDWVDIAAPGEDIYTTLPTYHVTYMNDLWCWSQNYGCGSGVTLATPIVAGVAALVYSKNPSYSAGKVTAILKANSDPYDSEYYLGVGRVNAFKSLMEFNAEPEKPDPSVGPSSGKVNILYDFSASSTDADDDQIFYLFDWGDNNDSGWIGPFNSGDTCTASHNWSIKGDYEIRVQAKDMYGLESEWSDPLGMSIQKSKVKSPFWYVFLKEYLLLFPFIKFIFNMKGEYKI